MKKHFFQLLFFLTTIVFLIGALKAQASNGVIESQAQIIVNGEKLQFSNPILIDTGSILLPMRAYFEAIGAEVSWDQPTQTATASRNGKKIDLTIHSLTAMVDDKPFTLLTPAILHNGQTYVPLRFVGESFDGTITWLASTNTAEIRFNEHNSNSLESKTLSVQQGKLPIPIQVEDSQFADDRRLLISDNPERLTSKTIRNAQSTLAIDFVKTSNKIMQHRIFGWHVNELGKTATIGITIENHSTTHTLTVNPLKEAAFHSSVNAAVQEVGLPLAEAILLNKTLTSSKLPIILAPGESKLLSKMLLKNEQLIGFMSDLHISISGNGEAQYAIRTVVSKTTNAPLEKTKATVVANDVASNHPRGIWPSSSIQTQLPAYYIDSAQIGYSFSNGITDHLYSRETALTLPKETVENPGHFGANYKVQIPIINESKKRKGIILKLTGRGGTYSGIIKYRGQTYIIPPLQAGTQYVQLPVYYTAKQNSTIELEFIHAGGSNLPLAIYIDTK